MSRPATSRPSVWVELLGAEVRFYDAGGVRTRCIEAGTRNKEAIIFLHGVGGHAEAFARNIMPLADRYRTVALDYLGFGLTDRPAGTPTAEEYVRHLTDFMDAAGIDKAHLVGESLGGWIAFWVALLRPARVGKLISVCGARLEVDDDEASRLHLKEGIERMRQLSARFAAEPSWENVRNRLGWLFHRPERDITDELVDIRWKLYQGSENAKNLGETTNKLVGDIRKDGRGLTPARLAQIKHPTLMLWTDFNPSITAATARVACAHLPNGSFRLMTDCAHWPQWESPEEFNAILGDFLVAGDPPDEQRRQK